MTPSASVTVTTRLREVFCPLVRVGRFQVIEADIRFCPDTGAAPLAVHETVSGGRRSRAIKDHVPLNGWFASAFSRVGPLTVKDPARCITVHVPANVRPVESYESARE